MLYQAPTATEKDVANFPILLTSQQVASILGISIETAQRAAARGDLPSKKIGNVWRFPKAKILALAGIESTSDSMGALVD